jgi:SAM-dependent methyltransferase
MGLDTNKREWESMAAVDPLWAILSAPEYQHGKWDPAAFFATGKEEIAALLRRAEVLGYPRATNRALDFGCGVGRLTRALADSFEECVGVDISERMLAQARSYNRDRSNCRFVLNETPDLRQFESESFDLVYSNIVLQHLPNVRLVRGYIAEFIRVIRRDGLVVFQLPCHIAWRHRLQLRRRLYGLLRTAGFGEQFLYGRLGLNPIRMLALPETAVARAVARSGAVIAAADPDREPGDPIQGRRYFVHFPDQPRTSWGPT